MFDETKAPLPPPPLNPPHLDVGPSLEAQANPPVEPAEIRLTELQHSKLTALLWQKRALFYKSKQVETMLDAAIEGAKRADLEFMRYARSLGIDVKRVFDISEAGTVTYPGSSESEPSKPPASSK